MLKQLGLTLILLSLSITAKAEHPVYGPFPPGYIGSSQHRAASDAHMRSRGYLPTPGIPGDYFIPIRGYDYTREPGFNGIDYGGKFGTYGGGLFQQTYPQSYVETRPIVINPPIVRNPIVSNPIMTIPPRMGTIAPKTENNSDTFPAPKREGIQNDLEKPSTDGIFPAPTRPATQQRPAKQQPPK